MPLHSGDDLELGWEEARQEIAQELKLLAGTPPIPQITGISQPVIHVIKRRIVACDPLRWLTVQKKSPRLFWGHKGSRTARAGIGEACDEFTSSQGDEKEFWENVSLLTQSPETNLFFAMSFNKTLAGSEWKSFKSMRAFLPRFEVTYEKGKYFLICNVVLGSGQKIPLAHILKELNALRLAEGAALELPTVLNRHNLPHYEAWAKNIELALEMIRNAQAEKVVLSRKVTLQLAMPAEPCALLEKMINISDQESHAFLFQFDDQRAFLGVSPELLYARQGTRLLSEAVAGTRPRGKTPSEDERLARELTDSAKERKEHLFVVSALLTIFRAHCVSYEISGEGKILKLPGQQHLISKLSGRLTDGISDKDLCRIFHPTPAVCGVPTDQAIRLIDQWEDFDRGWFAGPVGIISKNSSELAVAIRSSLIDSASVHLYSGAGIVDGSDPWQEWEELESKIQGFLDVFSGR